MRFVKDVTGADFEREVLERSASVPVVVDFWAAWCAPCRMLGPILEREVEALGGRVELAKVDSDRDPELARAYGVQGIPAVKAIKDRRVVAEFVGARDARFVQAWLAALAPSPGKLALERALEAMRAGAGPAVEEQLRSLLEDPQVASHAALALAQLLVDQGKLEDARAMLGRVDARSEVADEVEGVERRIALAADARAFGGEQAARAALAANDKDLDARWALASALAARGANEEALEQFLELVSRSRKYRDDGARLAMLALFDRLGDDHPLTREFRRRLQIVL